MTMLVSEKNRLGTASGAVSPRAVSPRIEAHIAWLEQELSDLDKGLRQTLRRSPVWREQDDPLRTVPGVGPQLSLTWLAHLPELSTLDRKQIAALVGVAPYNRDRGARRGKRAVWGGRSRVRAVLHRGALAASRHNPAIRDFHQGLLAAGKPKKAALVACMRKLPVMLNAMLKHGSPSWLPLARYGSASRRSCRLTFQTVAIGRSWFPVGLLSRKPLSQKHRSTFWPLQEANPTPSFGGFGLMPGKRTHHRYSARVARPPKPTYLRNPRFTASSGVAIGLVSGVAGIVIFDSCPGFLVKPPRV